VKYLSLILGLAVLPWSHLNAQVSVEVKLAQEQFLAGESIPVAARILNRSGQAVTFGDSPDWLSFTVEAHDDFVVGKNAEVPVDGEFTLQSSQVGIKHVDLAPYFVLSRPGRYNVIATLHLKAWDTQVTSAPVTFDIINGARLWTSEFGVPLAPGVTNVPPEVRSYSLEEANYLSSQLRLYLRVTDPSGSRIFKVVCLGQMVSFGQPEPQIDRASNLHVLYQTGAKLFNYTAYNPDGDLLLRQTYEYTDTRPRLKADDQGYITVVGGLRRPNPNDLPAAPSAAAQ
jgi:hypothetical protein